MNSKTADRFIRYVKVDTQSEEGLDKVPSTEKQWTLAKMLKEELESIGGSNVRLDEEHCYVYAEIPSNMDKDVPSIGFIAHMDTADAVSGKDVKPRIIENYDGKDIVLNKEKNIVTYVKNFPMLASYVGKTIIVTDGNTLLGGDDKAGVAEIMSMAEYFLEHPEVKHGKICIGFTPDEEVGNGTEFFNLDEFGADYAYTVDGGELGDLSYENFNAAGATLRIQGVSVHPGSAKNIMKNAITMAYEFQSMLPASECPECTEGYEGFYHAIDITGTSDEVEVKYIIRDHNREKFEKRKETFRKIVAYLNEKYGYEAFLLDMKDSYLNMREYIEKEMHLIDHAVAAMEKLGIQPQISPIRGGTDGAMLTYKGLCCPNLGTGSEGHHGRHEFACVESMDKIVELLIQIVLNYAS